MSKSFFILLFKKIYQIIPNEKKTVFICWIQFASITKDRAVEFPFCMSQISLCIKTHLKSRTKKLFVCFDISCLLSTKSDTKSIQFAFYKNLDIACIYFYWSLFKIHRFKLNEIDFALNCIRHWMHRDMCRVCLRGVSTVDVLAHSIAPTLTKKQTPC